MKQQIFCVSDWFGKRKPGKIFWSQICVTVIGLILKNLETMRSENTEIDRILSRNGWCSQ